MKKYKYVLCKYIPKSEHDCHRELPWGEYGAMIEKEVELTEEELNQLECAVHNDYVGDAGDSNKLKEMYESFDESETEILCKAQQKIRKVLE